jgi:hypothetical protein
MDKNIFLPTFGNKPEHIVGRDRIISNFMSGLSHSVGYPDRASVFIGQRGMGKTALLLEFATRAEKMGYIPVNVNASDKMLDEMLQIIQLKGREFVKGKGSKVKSVNVGVFGFSAGLEFAEEVKQNYGFRIKLTMLTDALDKYGKGILILVDEIGSNTSEMRELATTFQHLVGEEKNVAIAMAGLPGAISSVLHDDVLTFLNRARRVVLEPLSLVDIEIYYASVFKKEGKSIGHNTLNTAVKATLGYPYLLQLVGYYIMQNTGNRKTISGNIVDASVRQARRDLIESVHKTILKPLSDKDREFLYAMAQDQKASSISDIKDRMGVSSAYAQQYRVRLIESGVIDQVSRGKVEFAVPYLREYLLGELTV